MHSQGKTEHAQTAEAIYYFALVFLFAGPLRFLNMPVTADGLMSSSLTTSGSGLTLIVSGCSNGT